jgi:hypothetical protein
MISMKTRARREEGKGCENVGMKKRQETKKARLIQEWRQAHRKVVRYEKAVD